MEIVHSNGNTYKFLNNIKTQNPQFSVKFAKKNKKRNNKINFILFVNYK